jgi:molybdopterin converting factor small subunit
MSVQVRIPTVMRPFTGGESTVEAAGATVAEIVADLQAKHPGLGDRLLDSDGGLHRFVNLFLGDEDIRYLEGLATPVADGSEISIIPAVAGG